MQLNSVREFKPLFSRITGLTVATLIAQAFTLLSLAILGYMYSLTTVGEYQIFLANCSLFAPLAVLSYSHAIPNLSENDVPHFLIGGVLAALGVAVMVALLLWVIGYLFPLAAALWVLGWGFCLLADWLNVRNHRTAVIGLIKILNGILFCVYVLVLRFYDLDHVIWLIWGQVIITLLLYLTYFFRTSKLKIFSTIQISTTMQLLWSWRRNPLLLTPSQLLSAAVFNIPTLLVARFFGSAMAAQYGMTFRFCAAPLTLLGNSIAQVIHGDIAAEKRDTSHQSTLSWDMVNKFMQWISILVFFGILIVLPCFFYFVLGKQWWPAAIFCQILAPMFALFLYSTPMSRLYYIHNRQDAVLYMQGSFFLIAMAAFFIGIWLSNLWLAVSLFSIFGTLRLMILIRHLKHFTYLPAA